MVLSICRYLSMLASASEEWGAIFRWMMYFRFDQNRVIGVCRQVENASARMGTTLIVRRNGFQAESESE